MTGGLSGKVCYCGAREEGVLLAKTKTYKLHRMRNVAMREKVAEKANTNLNAYFMVAKERNSSVALLEGRAEPVEGQTCSQCQGLGKCDCFHCQGLGRANYTSTAVLPRGTYPVWCAECGGGGVVYCFKCQGTGKKLFAEGIGFRLPHDDELKDP